MPRQGGRHTSTAPQRCVRPGRLRPWSGTRYSPTPDSGDGTRSGVEHGRPEPSTKRCTRRVPCETNLNLSRIQRTGLVRRVETKHSEVRRHQVTPFVTSVRDYFHTPVEGCFEINVCGRRLPERATRD